MEEKDDRSTHYDEGSLSVRYGDARDWGDDRRRNICANRANGRDDWCIIPIGIPRGRDHRWFQCLLIHQNIQCLPISRGIGMYLHKAYGDRLPTAFNALLMYFSMVIAQSFLARTFGSYTMQLFGGDPSGQMTPILGVSLILAAFIVNLLGNRLIQGVAGFIGLLKIGGIPNLWSRRHLVS